LRMKILSFLVEKYYKLFVADRSKIAATWPLFLRRDS
jgi:hypothetical protein